MARVRTRRCHECLKRVRHCQYLERTLACSQCCHCHIAVWPQLVLGKDGSIATSRQPAAT
jgi:hypothetical protein